MNKIQCIPDVDEFMSAIIEELPNNRGEAYYALSMVLEMIESRRAELWVADPDEPEDEESSFDECEDCCEDCEDGKLHRYKLTIDAFDLEDLRAQMRDAFAHTFSSSFEKGEQIG